MEAVKRVTPDISRVRQFCRGTHTYRRQRNSDPRTVTSKQDRRVRCTATEEHGAGLAVAGQPGGCVRKWPVRSFLRAFGDVSVFPAPLTRERAGPLAAAVRGDP